MPHPQIKASLIRLLDAIKRSDGPQVSAEMDALERLAQEHRGELSPRLAHFIDRRSYAKALAYLETEDVA
jgi:hypothetical protein